MENAYAFGEKNYSYCSAYLKNKFSGQKVYKFIVDRCKVRDRFYT